MSAALFDCYYLPARLRDAAAPFREIAARLGDKRIGDAYVAVFDLQARLASAGPRWTRPVAVEKLTYVHSYLHELWRSGDREFDEPGFAVEARIYQLLLEAMDAEVRAAALDADERTADGEDSDAVPGLLDVVAYLLPFVTSLQAHVVANRLVDFTVRRSTWAVVDRLLKWGGGAVSPPSSVAEFSWSLIDRLYWVEPEHTRARLREMLGSPDHGVVYSVLRTVDRLEISGLRDSVAAVCESNSPPWLQSAAETVLSRLDKPTRDAEKPE